MKGNTNFCLHMGQAFNFTDYHYYHMMWWYVKEQM